MQSGMDLKGVRLFRYKVVLTQMEVDFGTHLKSIQHKLKSVRYKLKLTLRMQFFPAEVMKQGIDINVIAR